MTEPASSTPDAVRPVTETETETGARRESQTGTAIALWWLPVGAGGHVVRHTSRWWELLDAHRAHRHPQPLFHAALEVRTGESNYVIEMAPNWGGPPQKDRG